MINYVFLLEIRSVERGNEVSVPLSLYTRYAQPLVVPNSNFSLIILLFGSRDIIS